MTFFRQGASTVLRGSPSSTSLKFSPILTSKFSSTLRRPSPNPFLIISEEVSDALAHGKPVVALETAIVTHGMPSPVNLQTALSCESCVRESGAIPATIAILDGRIHVGLSKSQLECIADTKATPANKVSRRDIAAICAAKGNGGTTIAGTTVIAHLAGIKVFATGGLGGVHRGGENSLDISADLTELGRSPVAVFSGGVKSILDIGRTLEYLETQGVPVITYGKTREFPNFFSPRSGYQSPYNTSTPLEAAKIIYNGNILGLQNGMLFGCPIPEAYAAAGEEIQRAVDQAVQESEENGVAKRGKEVTPWLLNRVYELTQGSSIKNNIALITNACRIGGQVAVEYANLVSEGPEGSQSTYLPVHPKFGEKDKRLPVNTSNASDPIISDVKGPAQVVIVGGAAVDIISKANSGSASAQHTTVPGSVTSSLGGVARNVAEATHRILSSSSVSNKDAVLLISPVGGDPFGKMVHDGVSALGMRGDGLMTPRTVNGSSSVDRTAVCNMVLDSKGDLIAGVADMDITQSLTFKDVSTKLADQQPYVLMFDGNLSSQTISEICQWSKNNNVGLLFEPTSVPKSTKVIEAIKSLLKDTPSVLPGRMPSSPIGYISPNLFEVEQIYAAIETQMEMNSVMRDWWWSVIDDLGLNQDYQSQLAILSRHPIRETPSSGDNETLAFLTERGVARMAVQLLPFFQHLFIKCGKAGVLLAMRVPNTPGNLWAQEKSDPRTRRQVIVKGRTAIFVLKHFPAIDLESSSVVNVTGAGDSLVGSILASLASNPDTMQDVDLVSRMIDRAQRAAVLTLKSDMAVSPLLNTLGQ